MTYSVGGLIQAADYNGFINDNASSYNRLIGTGAVTISATGGSPGATSGNTTGDTGYGRGISFPTVAQNTLVTPGVWTNMITAMGEMATHQGTTLGAMTPTPTQGNLIQWLSTLNSNMNLLNTNRLNARLSGTDVMNTANDGGPGWTASRTCEIQFSFGDARLFFNNGGVIGINGMTMTNPNGAAQNTSWNNLLTAVGGIWMGASNVSQNVSGTTYQGVTQVGGWAGPNIYTRSGYYQLTGANQVWYRATAGDSNYTNNFVDFNFRLNGNTVIVTIVLTDNHTNSFYDNVTGTWTVIATSRPPHPTDGNWSAPWGAVNTPAFSFW